MKIKSMNKIVLVFVGIIVIAVVAAGAYWFSMPSELRNMMLWMVLPGESYENYQEYQTIDRNEAPLLPTSFDPVAAESLNGDANSNITVITEMVQNEDSKMLKRASVQVNGAADVSGWQLIADEGAAEGSNPFGPSPLSYYTAGLAANLHTQILRAAEVKGVELDSVKVEVLNKFRWDDMMSADGAGFLDLTTTNIIIESTASEDVIQEIKEIALNSWAAGEALKNETVIEPSLVINGDNWGNYRAVPGTTHSDESIVGEIRLSHITDVPKEPEYLEQSIEVDEDENLSIDFDAMSNMEFEIFAISESAENSQRPYLKKITVSTPTPETWEIYSDEFVGANDNPIAPTSLEYFTAGTSLCLTSQTTLVSGMMGLEFTDYRVEQQIDYRQEGINSTEMVGFADTVHTSVLVESDESEERLNEFFEKSLSLCFAGEGLSRATDMDTHLYLNGNEIE